MFLKGNYFFFWGGGLKFVQNICCSKYIVNKYPNSSIKHEFTRLSEVNWEGILNNEILGNLLV